MNIEFHFLKKAIEDKNFVSFSYDGKNFKKVTPFSISNELLKCNVGEFDIKTIKKLTILKDKF